MCDQATSEITSAVRAAVAASPEPITTQMIGDMMAARGLCRYHVLDALRVAHRKGHLRTREALQNANPFTFPDALWVVAETPASNDAEVLDPRRFAIPLPRKSLGRGGNGIVVLGLQLSIDRPCAIKLLDPELLRNPHGEPVQAKRFDREVRYLARLSHPNIITVYDGGRSSSTGAAYLAMELMEWPTLQQLLAERGALPPLLVAKIIRAVALGLQYAHERARIFHRDVKPANIFVSADLATAKVADFGLACLDDADLDVPARDTAITRAGPGLLGSPETAAPERYLAAKGDFRSDIYSLGITMYLALTGGVSPFPGIVRGQSAILDWVNAHQNVDTTALDIRHAKRCPDCPERLAQLLRRMIRREPAERPQSYAEVVRDLDRAIRDLEPLGSQVRPAPAAPSAPSGDARLTSASGEKTELAAALQGERFEAAFEVPTVLDPSVSRPAPLVLPTPDAFAPLLQRMTALEKRAEEMHGPDALYMSDQPLLRSLAARALEQGLLAILREIFEADAGRKCPEFERTYARLTAGEKLPPGTPEVPLPLTRYFYDAYTVAISTSDDRRVARAGELAERVLSFLEEALGERGGAGKNQEPIVTEEPSTSATPAADDDGTYVIGASSAHDPFAPGSRVGPLRIVREIGRGGMATVYLAHDQDLDRQVAVKVLNPSSDPAVEEENKRRFSRELKLAANLKHPNIVPIHATFVHEGRQCLVMDLVDGTSLAGVIRSATRIEPARALKIVRQVADGLGYAHKRDIVHRDIKPDNILVDVTDRAILIDFGLTKSVRMEFAGGRGPTTVQGTFLGTPHYTSPEQASGQPVDQRGDIYSLGATLYEMLSGARPFTAPTELSLLHTIADLKTLPEPLSRRVSGLDPELEVLVDRMMAKRPEERFLSCDDLVSAIDRILPRLERRPGARRLGRRVATAVAALAIAAIGVAAYASWPRRSAAPAPSAQGPKEFSLAPRDGERTKEITAENNHAVPEKSADSGEAKEPPKKPPSEEPSKPAAPPPYQPTEAELRFLSHVLDTVRKSFAARCAYGFADASRELEALARSPENTQWTGTFLRAESERLGEAGRLTSRRPLFPADRNLVLVLRDGKTLRGRVTSENADRVTVLLPTGLSEDVPLANVAPATLAAAFESTWEAFALRASAGDAAGAIALYQATPEALSLRVERGHLPGLVDEAVEEAFEAGGRGDLGPLGRLDLPAALRAKIPSVLGDRLARLDVERAAVALYGQKAEKEPRARLLGELRTTFAGLRLARDIMAEFKRDAEKNDDRELVTIPRWATWLPNRERAPKATFVCDQETKTYVVAAQGAGHRALILKKFAGSRKGYEVRVRLEQADAVAVVGLSLDRWVELSTAEVRFFAEGKAGGTAKVSQEGYRIAVAVLPDAASEQNLIYVNGHLTYCLDAREHPMGGGIVLGAAVGAVRVESLVVRNSQVHEDDE